MPVRGLSTQPAQSTSGACTLAIPPISCVRNFVIRATWVSSAKKVRDVEAPPSTPVVLNGAEPGAALLPDTPGDTLVEIGRQTVVVESTSGI
jgi:hypothetical protein